MEKSSKTRYNKEVQQRYKAAKRKKFACEVGIEDAEKIQQHYTARGFSSANSYLLSLIRADMSTAAEAVGAAPDDDIKDC